MYQLALMPGPGEWIIILLVVLLLFGGRKLPELAGAMGKSITQFKKGLRDEELGEGAKPKDPKDEGQRP